MPSSRRSKSARGRVPLADEIAATGPLRQRSKKRKSSAENEEDDVVDTKASRKILKISQDLIAEDDAATGREVLNPAFSFDSRLNENVDRPSDDEDDPEAWGSEDEVIEEADPDPNELEMFNRFLPSNPPPNTQPLLNQEDQNGGTNLADLILEKIAAHEALQARTDTAQQEDIPEEIAELHPKVIQVYSTVGLLLSRYKSGKLPKPFKIIPTLPQWEEILALTRPDSWTPNACFEATRIFVSVKPHITQSFLEQVILERVRDDIHETKKLNVHLYNTLKKALYKPAAFFKGFLFPLVSSGTCTLREAQIISSVLVRVSIPVLHSAAALLRLTEIAAEQTTSSSESAGATNVFIKVLLEKKYALPYKVIDGLVFHFLRFRATPADQDQLPDANALGTREAKLPVIWHQCLLAFAQRYRNDITEDQREALLDLLLVRGHKGIGPEVRRELLEGRGRGVPVDEGTRGDGNDDTMVVDPV